MPSPTPLYQIEECPDLYVDACVCDEQRNLIFLSAWGRDTVTQEFLARLTLGREEMASTISTSSWTAAAYLSSQTRISWRNAPPASSAAHCSGACSTSGCSIGALSFELTEEAFTGSVIAVMPDGTHVAACNRKRPNLQSAPF